MWFSEYTVSRMYWKAVMRWPQASASRGEGVGAKFLIFLKKTLYRHLYPP